MSDKDKIIKAFKRHIGVGFIGFVYESKANEVSKRVINLGASYENAQDKDFITLKMLLHQYNEKGFYIENEKYTKEDWIAGLAEMINSLNKLIELRKVDKLLEDKIKSGNANKEEIELYNNSLIKRINDGSATKEEIELYNRSQGQKRPFEPITNGLTWHVEKERLYVRGHSHLKTIIKEGIYKEVKSRPKTIAKNVIKNNFLRTAKHRLFILDNLQGNLKMNGEILEIE